MSASYEPRGMKVRGVDENRQERQAAVTRYTRVFHVGAAPVLIKLSRFSEMDNINQSFKISRSKVKVFHISA
jgi:hypothetical protein